MFYIFAFLIVFQRFKRPGEVIMLEENLWLSVLLQDKFRPQVRVILFQVNGFAVLFYCLVFFLTHWCSMFNSGLISTLMFFKQE